MKTVNYLLVGLLSLSALVGCNKDDNHFGGDGENNGELHAAFSIQMGGPGTYTDPATEAGDIDEGYISEVTIYVFNGSTLEANGTIAMPTNGGTGTETLSVTTGKKTVYALVNGGELGISVTNGSTTLAQFKDSLTMKLEIVEIANIATAQKFTMLGVGKTNIKTATHSTVGDAKTNACKINVNRVSAKVSFVYGSSVTHSLPGGFSLPKFALNQTHKEISISRELRNDADTTSPTGTFDYTETLPIEGDHVDTETEGAAGKGTYDHLNNTLTAYKDASDNFTAAIAINKSLYCIENINESPTTGNSTFVVVKLKYEPDVSEIVDGGAVTGTFATQEKGGVKRIFSTEAKAKEPANGFVSDTETPVEVHTDGMGYYRLNLRDKEKGVDKLKERYAVLRNHVYHVNVMNINNVGSGDPSDLIPENPETPIETSAHITAEITVLPWTIVVMNEDLN